MKPNIIIMGIGRAGKTTLSNIIKSYRPSMDLIHSDSFKWGIIRAQGLESEFRTDIAKQKEFELSDFFQKAVLHTFNSLEKQSKFGVILETGQISLSNLDEIVNRDRTAVVCLGLGEMSVAERVKLCRKYDKPKDWSYGAEESILMKHAEDWHKRDLIHMEECNSYGIKYFDTSTDREKTLQEIAEFLIR